MVDVEAGTLLAYVLLATVLFLVLRTFVTPLRLLTQAAYHLVVGGLMVGLTNLAGQLVGFHLALNPVSALLAGYLGLPGLLLLAALKVYLA